MLLVPPSPERARTAGRSMYRVALDVVLTGFAVILPLVITVYVLSAALDFVASALNPVIKVLRWAGLIEGLKDVGVVNLLIQLNIYTSVVDFLTELLAVLILGVGIVVIGIVARNRHGERLIDYFDYLISAIPGIGSVYKSFRRMGEVLLSSDTESFREVKLVEFPRDGAYVIGFETNESPDSVRRAAGRADGDMVTLFLPLAPNPVMGGFLAHIPRDRVHDIDMSVEEGVRSIITSGVATEKEEEESASGDRLERLREVTAASYVSDVMDGGESDGGASADGTTAAAPEGDVGARKSTATEGNDD